MSGEKRAAHRRLLRAAKRTPYRLRITETGPCAFDKAGLLAHRVNSAGGMELAGKIMSTVMKLEDGWAMSRELVQVLLQQRAASKKKPRPGETVQGVVLRDKTPKTKESAPEAGSPVPPHETDALVERHSAAHTLKNVAVILGV